MLPFQNMKRIILWLFVFSAFLLSACSSNSNDTSSGGGSGNANGFQALLGETFTHARCISCHGFQEGNATSQRHQSRPKNCTLCHGDIIADWRAPDASFSFTGLSTKDICEKSKGKFGNDVSRLQAHLKFDSFVIWGVDSGDVPLGEPDKPKAPPASAGAWRTLVDQWVANGAVCD